jgi:acetylornithine deacetylase/succinyl-diaminopimelate desuccinylase-like protein
MPLVADSVADLARSPAVRACLEWFRRERSWINEQHLKLCRIPAATFFEQKRAEWMAAQFRNLGWEAKLDRAGNVLAWLPGRRDDPSVAVTAHLDTVLAPRTADDIKVGGDGKLTGPGVSDNGAGLTALLALAAAWGSSPAVEDSPLAPLLVANVGEEGEGNLCGMRYLCRNLEGRSGASSRLKAFLVLDGPGADRITSRALASHRFDVTITGPGGHSWSDHGVGNPVHALSRAITLFTDAAGAERTAPGALEEGGGKDCAPLRCARPEVAIPRCSYNFGLIQGGASINSIPAEARAKVDLRSEDADRLEAMAALLASSVERAVEIENARATSAKVSARVREIGSRPAGGVADGAAILACLEAVDAHLGIKSYLDCSSTDANIPLSLGMPAVSIGAGGQGGGAHTPAEWYQPEGRELGLRRILLALCLLLGG